MKILDVTAFILANKNLFICFYALVIFLQILVVFFKGTLKRYVLFFENKIIAIVFIGYFLFYSQNLKGFFIYVFSSALILFFMGRINLKQRVINLCMTELFLVGDIYLMIAIAFIFFILKN